ncbi:MAG: glycosyltransferase family 4 protein [Planctomycetes bacterium]|nr:glycosyltransferase family 4 protein [Planctomycetota bacterium]
MRRVLHVFTFFRPDFTGEGIYLTNLMPHLQAQGFANDVLVQNTDPQGERVVHCSAPAPHTVHYLVARRKALRHLKLSWWLLRHGRDYDLVHFHSFSDRYFLGALVARLLRAKVVQSSTLDDGLGSVLASYRPLFRPVIRRLFRLVDASVSISPKLHADGEGVLPEPRRHLIPQGVTLPADPRREKHALRRSFGLDAADFVLVFVGGICERKAPHELVEGLIELHPRHPRLHLFLVGPDLEDEYAARLRRRVSEAGLSERVHFTGFAPDPSRYYGMADAMVFASTKEGFGNVLLEAMAHALPTVARRLPGVTDYFIDSGRTGILFDDRAGYVAAVETLLADPELVLRLGSAARAEVEARFRLEAIGLLYGGLYQELLGGASGCAGNASSS